MSTNNSQDNNSSSSLSSLNDTLLEFRNISKSNLQFSDFSLKKPTKRPSEVSEFTPSAKIAATELSLMSPWEFRRVRSELAEAKSQIIRLEDRIDQLHRNNKEAVILFEKEKSEMKLELDSNRGKVNLLEDKLKCVRLREADLRDELLDLREKGNAERILKQRQLSDERRENAKLRLKIEMINGDPANGTLDNNKYFEMEENLQRTQLELEEQIALYNDLNSKFMVAMEDIRDFEKLQNELQATKDKLKDLERNKIEWEDLNTMRNRLVRTEELEIEVGKQQQIINDLRVAIRQQLLQKEQLTNLQREMDACAGQQVLLHDLKEYKKLAETELSKWHKFAPSPAAMQSILEKSRNAQMETTLETAKLKTRCAGLIRDLELLQLNLDKTIKERDELKEINFNIQTEIQTTRRKSALLIREVNSYKQRLDLLEALKVTTDVTLDNQPSQIKELETMITEYRDQMEILEEQLRIKNNPDKQEKHVELESEILKLKCECTALLRRRDELEEFIEKNLSAKETSNECQILHLRDNPFHLAETALIAEASSLKAECEALKARVRLLEAGEQLNLTVKMKENVSATHMNQVQELEEQLKSAQLKITRLKEVFRTTGQDFRDVTYMLLGYRIDLVANKVYKLTNMYSEDPEDFLMFQQNKQGIMELLENPYATTLHKMVDEHLLKGNSIPCFLSAITLYLTSNDEYEASIAPSRSSRSAIDEEEEEERTIIDQQSEGGDDEDSEDIAGVDEEIIEEDGNSLESDESIDDY